MQRRSTTQLAASDRDRSENGVGKTEKHNQPEAEVDSHVVFMGMDSLARVTLTDAEVGVEPRLTWRGKRVCLQAP